MSITSQLKALKSKNVKMEYKTLYPVQKIQGSYSTSITKFLDHNS